MKKSISIVIIMFIMMFLIGCTKSSYVIISGQDNDSSTQMSMTYEQFSGYKETQIKVKDGEEVKVSVKIATAGGTIDAYIAKDNNESTAVYKGNDIKSSNFTVTLKEAGTYTIRVDGDKHTGGYLFNWGK